MYKCSEESDTYIEKTQFFSAVKQLGWVDEFMGGHDMEREVDNEGRAYLVS